MTPEIAKSKNPEILVIKPSSLGDIVHTLPSVVLLKRRWPAAHLRWLINPEWAPLLEGNPSVDEVVPFPRGEFRGVSGWTKIPGWVKKIAAKKSDLVLDYQGLLRSALIGRVCRRSELLGLSDAREGARLLYDHTADVRGIDHAVDRYLALTAVALGCQSLENSPPDSSRAPKPLQKRTDPLEWPLPRGSAPERAPVEEPFVLLHPFSRGGKKSLPIADVLEFCRALAPRRVVIVGRTSKTIPPLDNVTNLLNQTTLLELIWLIRSAAFVVSVDSGPMHIAAALTARLISIHTWSDPRRVGPYQPEAWIWKDGAIFQMKDAASPDTHQAAPNIAAIVRFVGAML